ncbi:hypothetical protein HK405_015046 [Cladochytrium tenue]|nr:hypothetical protein HK405_015046 [Cladochytrium tenue]
MRAAALVAAVAALAAAQATSAAPHVRRDRCVVAAASTSSAAAVATSSTSVAAASYGASAPISSASSSATVAATSTAAAASYGASATGASSTSSAAAGSTSSTSAISYGGSAASSAAAASTASTSASAASYGASASVSSGSSSAASASYGVSGSEGATSSATSTSVISYGASASTSASATSTATAAAVTDSVVLDYATVTGYTYEPFSDNTTIRAWLGIPYAQPPLGSLRFMAPAAIETNLGNISATSFGAMCLQNNNTGGSYSEDCLTVNVWAPAGAKEGSLPVMVFTYGGAFRLGGSALSNYPGGNLAYEAAQIGQDVVVVTYNYRVDVFGFTASPEIEAAGGLNAGLQDQVAVYRWVRKYISGFGGDPTKVTAFGQSAGAMSIGTHLTAAHTDGESLFDAAIVESGGTGNYIEYNWTTVYEHVYTPVATTVNCSTLACMQAASGSALLAASKTMLAANPAYYYAPYVDYSYIPENPALRLAAGEIMDVPLLLGTNTDEGANYTATITTLALYEAYLSGTLAPYLTADQAAAIYALYPYTDYTNTTWGADYAYHYAAAAMFADWTFICSNLKLADFYSQLSTAVDSTDSLPKVYKYHFNHLPYPHSYLGVWHTAELPYVFHVASSYLYDEQYTLSQTIVGYWTAFATSLGDPNAWSDSTLRPVEWPKYQRDAALDVGGGSVVRFDSGDVGGVVVEVDNSRTAKCAAWDVLQLLYSYPPTISA